MNFYLYDDSKKTKLQLEPIKNRDVRIYVCGPTVYDYAHLGHARSAITFDLLRRVLKALKYNVTFVCNITDIDDKIIKKCKEQNTSLQNLTEYFAKVYRSEMRLLNVISPDITPKATKNLDEMVGLVKILLDKNIAYKIDNDIYFDTSKDSLYGKVSNKTQEEKLNRVSTSNKRNEEDFVLWKSCKDEDDICFDTILGRGRPGWHLECSAMIKKHLSYKDEKYQIDIHGGGADLFFPHHENEAAQTRCAYETELAKYWIHNGFVKINNEKMSKSLGNSFYLKDALKVYHSEALRFYLLSTHYRSDFNFNEQDLLSSKKRLDKLYRLKKRVFNAGSSKANSDFKNNLLKALSDDLNISLGLSIVDEMISKCNQNLDNQSQKNIKKECKANIEFINEIMGIGLEDAYEYFQHGISSEKKQQIQNLINLRDNAEKQKDYKTADKIREELKKMNITIMDTPQKTVWEANE